MSQSFDYKWLSIIAVVIFGLGIMAFSGIDFGNNDLSVMTGHVVLTGQQNIGCNDSDNGRNYVIAGTVNYSPNNYSYCVFGDSCQNAKTVKEYYCYNNSVRYIYYNCGTRGCSNGKCGASIP